MGTVDEEWERRSDALWKSIDDYEEAEFIARIDALAAELPEGSAVALFERAFLALALVDVGREREAVAESLTALSKYLPRYNRSLARYAEALADPK